MNPLAALPVALILSVSSVADAAAVCTLRAASFNIHYIVPKNGIEPEWEERKAAVTGVLKRLDADLLAFQEMETFTGGNFNGMNLQLDWILDTVPGYAAAAIGDPAEFPITQPILYRPQALSFEAQGFFFYSDEADRIYTRQWDGGYPYFSSWVKFRDHCAGRSLYLYNVHNDYSSRDNRIKTSELIAERIRSITGGDDAVIVLGDFNSWSSARELRLIEAEGLRVVPPSRATNRLWGMHLLPAIDHIMVGSAFDFDGEVRVWRDRFDGVYPSDHYPISVDLRWIP